MIEELTPQVMMVTMLLLVIVVPTLTLVLSAGLLWRYRRAVDRAMGLHIGQASAITAARPAVRAGGAESAFGKHVLLERATRRPWYNAVRYALGGLAFALVFAVAAQVVFPSGLGVPGFLIAVWMYAWPLFVALPMIVPLALRHRVAWFIGYVVVLALLAAWGSTVHNLPAYRFGGIELPSRSTVTPEGMVRLWLTVNAAPTALMMLCLHRSVRAVAPLVLALVTATAVGVLAAYLALFSPRGANAAVALAVSLNVHIYWLLLAALLTAVLVCASIGWALMRWIAHAYQRGRVSDQSLLMSALWLLFASTYGMWLVRGGLVWIASVPAAFVAFRLTWSMAASFMHDRTPQPVGLTFLRVFSLGRHSEALLETVAGYWRYVGGIQLITGPDLARATVQPHQFLDYLGGKLHRHFVSDAASLERSLAERDRGADLDGRFRINNFYCHADSWKAVLPRLVAEGDLVLMDLRRFSSANAGCTHELGYLVAEVPYRNCLLLIDERTDEAFLDATLESAASTLTPASPNHGQPITALRRWHPPHLGKSPRELIDQLASAASSRRRVERG